MVPLKYTSFGTLRVTSKDRVVTVVVDNPPLNLITLELLEDLERFTQEVADDPHPLVVVLKSANPDIFITHNEFANLYNMQPPEVPASAEDVTPNRIHYICERLRTMDKITIAQVEGRATGGGATMVMNCDMRFGAIGKAIFNTMAVPIGCVPGGGASQYLPRLIGRSRAIELIMGGLDLDAVTADRWGYLNRALQPQEIDTYVSAVVRRIASCPSDAVRLTKEAIALSDGPIEAGLREENFRLRKLMASEDSLEAVKLFLALGGETHDGEMRIEALLGDVLQQHMP